MKRLIIAELLKLRTTRSFWAYIASAIAFVPVSVSLAMTSNSDSIDSAEGVRNVFAAASSGGLILLILGITVTAGEFRHGTATSTFLITPDRGRVVQAKVVAAASVGLGVAVVASIVTMAMAVPWLESDSVDVSSYAGEVATSLTGSTIATVLAAVVGVGFGALVTNQTLALSIALVWGQVVESLLVAFLPEVGRWLPGGAASALAGIDTANGGMLPAWGAGVVLLAYGIAFAAAGDVGMSRRDHP